jgi:hypothetical protein
MLQSLLNKTTTITSELDATLCWKALIAPTAPWNHSIAAIQFLLRANYYVAATATADRLTMLLLQLSQVALPFLLLVLPKHYNDDHHSLQQQLREVTFISCFDCYFYYSKAPTTTTEFCNDVVTSALEKEPYDTCQQR